MPYSSSYGYAFRSSVSKWVLRLLIANTAVFVAVLVLRLAGLDVGQWLVLFPSLVLRQPWTLVTHAFVHVDPFLWFFNMLALFFFGPRLEERWGGGGFLRYYAVAVLAGAVCAIPANVPLAGATLGVEAILLAWALYWPREEVLFFGVFPVQIRWMVIAMLGLSVLSAASVPGRGGFRFLGPMAGALLASYLYLRSPWAPRAWGELPARPRPAKKAPQKAVVQWTGKREGGSSSAPRPASAGAGRSVRAEKELLDDVDRILDKISAEGLSALSEEERKRLDEVSRRFRTN